MQRRWSTLLVAFISKNIAMSATFGCFGLILPALVNHFASDVTTISVAIALVSLVMGVAAPAVGYLLDRWSMAGTVTGGALVTAAGFGVASNATSAWQFILAYGLLGGLGVTAMGALPAAKLAAAAFPAARGKAIGVAMLPLSSVAAPLICAPLLALCGWRLLLQGFAVLSIFTALLAAVLVLRNASPTATPTSGIVESANSTSGVFGAIALSAGILLSGGILLMTYIAPHARNIGMDAGQSAALLAVAGGAAIPGAYLFAWLADRISPARALIVNAALQSILWLMLACLPASAGLWLTAGLIGLCAGGANPTFSVCIASLYGQRRFGAMLGRLSLVVVPFTIVATPLAGWSFDVFGDYVRLLWCEAALCAAAVIVLFRLDLRLRRLS